MFLDIEVEGKRLGTIEIKLYFEMKRTSYNFMCLCTGELGIGELGKPLHFKGSKFHRIVPGFCIQGGDIINGDGTGGESVYGGVFNDEGFYFKHNKKYVVGMANLG